jgi:N-acetylated-alpha-linked acidic dipeptidase
MSVGSSVPNAASAIAASRLFATKPHMAGTPGDLTTAMDFLRILQTNLGIDSPAEEPVYAAGSVESRNATLSIPLLDSPTAWVDTYYPVLNTPLDRALEVLDEHGNSVWKANLEEIPDEADPEAAKYFDAIPAFHGLSKDGEVQGQLVYANYGTREDYNALVASGVDLTGKIVIARYGSVFRGLKIKGAQELGAVGVLLYSDLRDDGSVTEENGYIAYVLFFFH